MTDARTMVDRMVDLVRLEEIAQDVYRTTPRHGMSGRIFGGQAIAQALMAAQMSVTDDKVAHSLHAYFLRAGKEAEPVILRVSRDRDGGSFASRRVTAEQDGAAILTLSASFQRPEQGLSHAATMPEVTPPEMLPSLAELAPRYASPTARAYLSHPTAFDIRPVGAPSFLHEGPPGEPVSFTWLRLRAPLGANETVARPLLAYASDYALLSATLTPHAVNMFEQNMQTASLDHALWFHGPVSLDDWLLHATRGEWAGGGRGFASGTIYTRDGRLIARTAQEGLIRIRLDREASGTVPHVP